MLSTQYWGTGDTVKEIILVEDSEADAALLRRALNYFSIANPIRHFYGGAEAVAYLDAVAQTAAINPPPISTFFLDLVLPGTSGLQILQHIANQPIFDKTLRIILTNLCDTDTIKRCYSLGAHSFLIKPIQTSELSELIAAFPGYWSFNLSTFAQKRCGVPAATK